MIAFKGRVLSRLLRFQRRTWRIRIDGREHLTRLYAEDKHFLLCFWHGKYVPIFPLLEGCEACVITSLSKRGSIIAEICKNFGYQSARIPDQPRHDSLRLMGNIFSEARAGAFAVDGPLGPHHRVKSGVIRIASTLGFDLLPVSVDSRLKMVINKRWDRMEIPLPFTKICLVFGEPIKVPPEIPPKKLRAWADNLAKAIAQLDKTAENMFCKSEKQNVYLEKFDQ